MGTFCAVTSVSSEPAGCMAVLSARYCLLELPVLKVNQCEISDKTKIVNYCELFFTKLSLCVRMTL